MMKHIAVIITMCLTVQFAAGQTLNRKVYLGIRMENITDDAKRLMGLEGNGILISEVFALSTAEKAGFKKGDVLSRINDVEIKSIDDVMSSLKGQIPGKTFTYELIRDRKSIKGKSNFQKFPEEKYNDLDVIYSESNSSIGVQRMIITKPKTKARLPVIAFIGGVGCYSLDNPFDTSRSETQLLNYLSRSGFLCARLEKPGMGDNAGSSKACNEVGFLEETEGYINAVNALKQRADVDSSQIYIVGHSMGGVFAPLIAQSTTIRGIVSYGTIGSSFIEYLAKTRRTIAEAYAMNPVETDDLIRDFCECSAYYFAEKLTTEQAMQKKKVCGEYLSIFDLRSRKYNDELYAINIPQLWSTFKGKALFIWGESDYIAAKEDHQIVNDAVNFYHKGNSEFITVKNAEHGMRLAASFREAQSSPGPYNAEVGKTIISWLRKAG